MVRSRVDWSYVVLLQTGSYWGLGENVVGRLLVGLGMLSLIFGPANVTAEGILSLEGDSHHWNLVPYLDYVAEGDEEISIADVVTPSLSHAFAKLGGETVNLGIREEAYWFRATISNPREERRTFYVEIDNARFKRVDFHGPDLSNSPVHQKAGTLTAYQDRSLPYRYPVFEISLEPGASQTIYFRAFHRGSFRFNANVYDVNSYIKHDALRSGLFGMFYGALLIMFSYNFILFMLFRDRSFLFLSCLILATGFYMLLYQRVAGQFLWPGLSAFLAPRLNLVVGLGLCSGILFSREFLGTATSAPRWDLVLRVYAVVSLMLCLDFSSAGVWGEWIVQVVGGLASILFVISGVIAIRNGNRYAWCYLIAWGAMFGSMIPFALLGAGVLPQNFLFEHCLKLAFPLGLALNSTALWLRFRELQEKHTAHLDEQVRLRTAALTEALENVKTLRGLIPICTSCKSIRDDSGFWHRVESYLESRSGADVVQGMCPECMKLLYNYNAGRETES